MNLLYNINNQRSAKLINGIVAEKYLWLNQTTLLAVYDKYDNLIMRFYYSNDRVPYKVKHLNQIYYLSYNHQGSLKQVTDTNGQTVKSIIYSAYGTILNDTNPNLNIPIGFAGGLYDKDTKLTKFGYREYDSNTGRWTTKDPIDFEGGDSNLYGYVLNDPVNFVDPEGLNPLGESVLATGYLNYHSYMLQYHDPYLNNMDKIRHCLGTCQAANLGPTGKRAAEQLSRAKEWFDEATGSDALSCANDMKANKQGLKGGDCAITCSIKNLSDIGFDMSDFQQPLPFKPSPTPYKPIDW